MATCSKCGAAVADGAGFCGSCGTPISAAGNAPVAPAAPAASAAGSQSGGLAQNVAGLLAYVTIIPPILFLVMEPYNKNKFVRFHAFQSLFFYVAMVVLSIGLAILGIILGFIPVVGLVIDMLLWVALWLAIVITWIILLVKAYGNVEFKLPVIGKLAAQQAAK